MSQFTEPRTGSYARKPFVSREGANVSIMHNAQILESNGGPYQGPYIHQAYHDLPNFDGNIPVIGSWTVDGYSCGMGIREDGLITTNLARFVPHIID